MGRRLLTPAQCDRLRRLCQQHPMKTAAAIVGVSASSVAKLRARGWVAAAHRRPPRPRPGDFVIQCEVMTKKELCIHYRAGEECVRRWSREVARPNRTPRRDPASMTIQPPDGSPAALERHGGRGTPAALRAFVEQLGPYDAAAAYGVSYGTLKKWRRQFGLPVSWSRQPGARRGRKPVQPSQVGWIDRRYQDQAGKLA